jgi:putative membrane protein
MKPKTKSLVAFVIVVHLMFFILEAMFWMQPLVYSILLVFLDNHVALDFPTQALTLKNLFVNQGFYNLFLALAGIVGWRMLSRGDRPSGYLLMLLLCLCGCGAGMVLAFSTKAYILAFFQAVPAALAAGQLYPLYRQSVAART